MAFYRAAFDGVLTSETAADPNCPRTAIIDLGGGAALNVFEVAALHLWAVSAPASGTSTARTLE